MREGLNRILVRARRQVFSERVGNNPSIFHGEGYDFIELREYVSGDDIKKIDWNITAKLQKPYVKVFREERELNVCAALMLGGSVHFGSKRLKQDLIAEIFAVIAFSALKNGDLFSSFSFAETLHEYSKPTKRLFTLKKMVEDIVNFDAVGRRSNYEEMNSTLMSRLRRKSLVILIGDFFEIPNFRVLAKKHEVVAIITRDKLEERPPAFGFATLRDPESSNQLIGDFNTKSVNEYSKKISAHDHALYERFRKDGIRFTKIYTDETPYNKLIRLFGGRR